MAVSAHTHFSTGYRSVLGYQSSITPFPAENQVLLNFDDASRGQVLFALGSSNALQRAEMGWGTDESQDPKGCVLRKLRLERNLDPAVLATRACVSVKQLFALEKGLDQPFPSDTLRRQAGRKVARILGMDWDSL